MKKILILAYIVAVLILSGMVKADSFGQALVENAIVTSSGVLSVEGSLSNPCHLKPKIIIETIDETQKILTLSIQTQMPGFICLASVPRTYKLLFDLKTLALSPGSEYAIRFANALSQNSLTYRAVSGDFNVEDYKDSQREFVGTLLTTDGKVILKNKGEVIPVISPSMAPEISKFQGEVHITGYAITVGQLNSADGDTLALSSQNQALGQVIVPVSLSQ